MEALALTGAIIALAGHFPLYLALYRKQITLNLATWTLWAVADLLSIVTSVSAGSGLPLLAITYMTGSLIAVLLIIRNGYCKWGKSETFTTGASLLCLILWLFSGPLVALVAITLGKYGAGLPSLYDAISRPERKQAASWLMFSGGALLNVVAQGSWTAANSFYPTVGCLFNGAMAATHLLLPRRQAPRR